ncbi:MAG: alpha/beta fold hydrolase [Gammaproteobacteria bacterium]|nr:alpha/beta fold hydrolase [Gammaproteobacteria bacterium]MBI5617533.1 alpha/beta fold hydrolase [Gammaproteobacteria bacterium]
MGFIALLLALGVTGFGIAFVRRPEVFLDAALRAARRAAKLETRRIRAGDHEIAYLDGGSGEPLVLLHGFGANKDHWPTLAKQLVGRYRIIAPDVPGFGESDKHPALRYAIDDQVERIHAFVAALGLERFHLGGNSMGGQLAAAYAARHPERVMSLWLLAPAGVATAQPSELQAHLARGENPLLVDDAAGFARLVHLCFSKAPYVPGPFQRVLAARAVAERPFNDKIFQDWLARPAWLESRVEGLHMPTLVSWGEEDRVLHHSGAAILGRLVPEARVVVMPGVGHLPMMERPGESAAQFLEFRKATA